MNEQEYRKHSALGSTDVKTFISNPRKFWFIKTGKYKEEKDCFTFGNLFHTYLLEPEHFDDRFVLCPYDSFRTNASKDWRDSQTKSIFVQKDLDLVKQMAEKCYELPMFRELMDNGYSKKEVAYFGEVEGVQVKCKIDIQWELPEGLIIIDPKTTGKEATNWEFEKSIVNNGYHFQQWLYEEILKQNGLKVLDYLFLFVSSLPYSGAGLKKIVVQNIEHADTVGRSYLKKYKQYVEKYGWEKPWPESDPVEIVGMPQYGYYQGEAE